MRTRNHTQLGLPVDMDLDKCWWKADLYGYPNPEDCWSVNVDGCKVRQEDDPRMAPMSFSPVTGPRMSGRSLRRHLWIMSGKQYLARTVVLTAKCGNAECINPDHAVMKEKQAAIHAKTRSRSKKAQRERREALGEPFSVIFEKHAGDGEWLCRFLVLAVWLEYSSKSPSNKVILQIEKMIPDIWPDFTLDESEMDLLLGIPIRAVDPGEKPMMEDSALIEALSLKQARELLSMRHDKYDHVLYDVWRDRVAPGAYDSINVYHILRAWQETDALFAKLQQSEEGEDGEA